MIGQITPLVQVAGKRAWFAAAAAHIIGAALSAALLGFCLGLAGLVLALGRLGAVANLIAALVFFACALRDAALLKWWMPTLTRQTPKSARCVFGTTWSALVWGVDLGQGWSTRIVFSGYYALIVWALLTAQPFLGAAVLGAFGCARGAPVLLAGVRSGRPATAQLAEVCARPATLLFRMDAAIVAVV